MYIGNFNMALFRAILLLSTILVVKGNYNDRAIAENCMMEVGISSEEYKLAIKDRSKDANEKIKCVDACLLKSYEVMDENGTISLDKIMEFITDATDEEKDAKRKAFEGCISTAKNDNVCDRAHNMITCMNEAMRKITT